MSPIEVAVLGPVSAAVIVGGLAWLLNKLQRARDLATSAEIGNVVKKAIGEAKDDIKSHVDEQIAGVNVRIDGLTQSVVTVDARERETRNQLAELKGRFDERTAMQNAQQGVLQ